MRPSHRITIHWRQEGRTITHDVPEGEYILHSFEEQGDPLPFSCRNGCCTECAVRVKSGTLDQREAMGLSRELRDKGYGLLCVARAVGPWQQKPRMKMRCMSSSSGATSAKDASPQGFRSRRSEHAGVDL